MRDALRFRLAVGANVVAVGVALTGSGWLWLRAVESDLPAYHDPSLRPVLEEVRVPLAVDPRADGPSRRTPLAVERPTARPPAVQPLEEADDVYPSVRHREERV